MKARPVEILRVLYRDRRSGWATRVFLVFVFFAVFGDFIANDKPLYCKYEGRHYFPVLRAVPVSLGIAKWPAGLRDSDWHSKAYDKVVFPPIPYSASKLDLENADYVSPFAKQNVRNGWFRHWLGTDNLGRDVVAGLIRGCRISLIVGLVSMLLAALLGIPLGAVSGYFGNERQQLQLHRLLLYLLAGLLVAFYLIYAIITLLGTGWTSAVPAYLGLALVVTLLALVLDRKWFARMRSRYVRMPWDNIVMRSVEVLRSIPAFFLLFAVLGIVREPSLLYVVLLIAVLRSPIIIRYVRAEALKVRDQTFVDAARVIGLGDWAIIKRHIIPNTVGPVLITMAFGMGTAVLLESGLSFLGIGSGLEEVTWGKMLNEARTNFKAWWLAVFPGLAIFLMIASFNRMGDTLTQLWQRK